MKKKGAKERIIATAIPLFCERGFKTTGIDVVLKQAGVAKMSLYYHFPSKEDLVTECLRILDERNFSLYVDQITKTGTSPLTQLRNALVPLRQMFANGVFAGCPFIRAAVEYGDPADAAHVYAVSYKNRFRDFFRSLAEQADLSSATELANQVQVIFDGAMVLYQLRRDPSVLDAAEKTLHVLIDRQAPTPSKNARRPKIRSGS